MSGRPATLNNPYATESQEQTDSRASNEAQRESSRQAYAEHLRERMRNRVRRPTSLTDDQLPSTEPIAATPATESTVTAENDTATAVDDATDTNPVTPAANRADPGLNADTETHDPLRDVSTIPTPRQLTATRVQLPAPTEKLDSRQEFVSTLKTVTADLPTKVAELLSKYAHTLYLQHLRVRTLRTQKSKLSNPAYIPNAARLDIKLQASAAVKEYCGIRWQEAQEELASIQHNTRQRLKQLFLTVNDMEIEAEQTKIHTTIMELANTAAKFWLETGLGEATATALEDTVREDPQTLIDTIFMAFKFYSSEILPKDTDILAHKLDPDSTPTAVFWHLYAFFQTTEPDPSDDRQTLLDPYAQQTAILLRDLLNKPFTNAHLAHLQRSRLDSVNRKFHAKSLETKTADVMAALDDIPNTTKKVQEIAEEAATKTCRKRERAQAAAKRKAKKQRKGQGGGNGNTTSPSTKTNAKSKAKTTSKKKGQHKSPPKDTSQNDKDKGTTGDKDKPPGQQKGKRKHKKSSKNPKANKRQRS